MKSLSKKTFATILLAAGCMGQLAGQTIIRGKVVNANNEPLPSASIRIKESGSGVNADSVGNFSITVQGKGKRTVLTSSVGYRKQEIPVMLNDSTLQLSIVLQDKIKSLGEVVVIGAGSFEASDKAKGASLTPMDAVTVAGSNADLANALRSLPGAQQIGEREGLYVRGGTGAETKQFVDGVLLKNPNFSSVPGIPQPARLNPFLFKGILFSSGGYSALYGDALSSALILESVDLPDESAASLHIFPQSLGVGLQRLTHNKKSSYGINPSYTNMKAYDRVIRQQPDFFHHPEYMTTDANFHIKTSQSGMLKFYTNYGYTHTGMRNADPDSNELFSVFELKGTNSYNNLSYREYLGNDWKIDAATAYNYARVREETGLENSRKENIILPEYPYDLKTGSTHTKSAFAQGRAVLTKGFGSRHALRFGSEYFYDRNVYTWKDSGNAVLSDRTLAAFAETDLRVSKNIAARIGLRTEHSALLKQTVLAPRISLAYHMKDGGQINLAYGIFYQRPENEYLLYDEIPGFTKATHYIANYTKKAGNRLFRVEAYYKKYSNLVTTLPSIKNEGSGYAKGIELFWRDKRTFKGFDYWITYSYLDTKRKFLNYPGSIRPDFSTPHTASVAIKKYFQYINFSANLSYFLATGRPYYDIKTNEMGSTIRDQGITNNYNAMNLSFAYMFSMFPKWKHKDFSGIGFGINNVFGTRQIFGYRYSLNGLNKMPITQPAARSIYLGLFMSFGIDMRDDFIDQNL